MYISTIFLLLYTLNLFSTGQTQDYQCGQCICHQIFSSVLMDCRDKDLQELPLIEQDYVYGLTTVYLNNNKIKTIDMDIINSWNTLEFIDLTGNPLSCSELHKIPKEIQVIGSCEMEDKFRGMYFIIVF